VVVVRLSTVSPGADVIVVVVSEVGCDGKINRDVAVVYPRCGGGRRFRSSRGPATKDADREDSDSD
jgi:hypothetical protein